MQEQKEKKNVLLVVLLVLICLTGIGISTVDYLFYFKAIENKKEGLKHYVRNELDEAIAKLESADQKDKEVLYYLGVAYKQKKNYQRAAECFEKALKEKHLFRLESPVRGFVSKSANELAGLYESGDYGRTESGEPDYEKAAEFYQVSFAVESNPEAAYRLGRLYWKGSYGKTKDGKADRKTALEYYQAAAILCRGAFSGEPGIGELSARICDGLVQIYMDGRIDYVVIAECYEQVLNPDYSLVQTYYYKAAREQGSAEGAYRLGKLYAENPGFQKKLTNGQPDYQKAAEYYLSAAAKGHSVAAFALGRLYEHCDIGNDLGSTERFAKAAEFYEKAAASGDPEAMYRMGELYRMGHKNLNGKINAMKAEEWYRKAFSAGSGEAAYRLGFIRECGSAELALYKITFEEHVRLLQSLIDKAELLGTMKEDLKRYRAGLSSLLAGRPRKLPEKADYRAAAEYYQKAIDLGSESAVLALGMLYWRGDYGTLANNQPDYAEACKYFSRGNASYQHPNAAIDLHIEDKVEKRTYHSSDISPWLFKRCMELAAQGNPDGLCELGNLYSRKKEYEKALECYEKAVEKGSGNAVILLSWLKYIILPDQAGKADYSGAEKALKAAMKKGISEAVFYYIEAIRNEKPDTRLVQQHLEILAEKGNLRAIHKLAEYYAEGVFTSGKADNVKAAEYYGRAFAAGDMEAAMKLAELYLKGHYGVLKDGSPDYKKVTELFRKVYEDKKVHLYREKAARELGKMYHYGLGVKKDPAKALFYYRQSLTRSPFPEMIELLLGIEKISIY